MMTMMSGAQNENAAGATVNEGPDRLQARDRSYARTSELNRMPIKQWLPNCVRTGANEPQSSTCSKLFRLACA